MGKQSSLADITPEIKPQETMLFSAAARNPRFKDFILEEIEKGEVTPAAKRIALLILGGAPASATTAERMMAWEFAQMLPEDRRLMKSSSSVSPPKAIKLPKSKNRTTPLSRSHKI